MFLYSTELTALAELAALRRRFRRGGLLGRGATRALARILRSYQPDNFCVTSALFEG